MTIEEKIRTALVPGPQPTMVLADFIGEPYPQVRNAVGEMLKAGTLAVHSYVVNRWLDRIPLFGLPKESQ